MTHSANPADAALLELNEKRAAAKVTKDAACSVVRQKMLNTYKLPSGHTNPTKEEMAICDEATRTLEEIDKQLKEFSERTIAELNGSKRIE